MVGIIVHGHWFDSVAYIASFARPCRTVICIAMHDLFSYNIDMLRFHMLFVFLAISINVDKVMAFQSAPRYSLPADFNNILASFAT